MTVQINAIPWATVRIMSKSRNGEVHEGVTPLALELSHGEYTVEFQNKLYRPVSRSFTVAPNGSTVLTVTMPTADVDQMVADILGPAS